MKCDLDRISVHYVSLGDGIPLLGLHGMGSDHTEMLYELEPILSKRSGWRRIYVDLPGHGETASADWITSIAQVFDVLTQFVDAVFDDGRFVVAGASYGAYMAQGLVQRFGGRLDGVWMNVPAVTYPRASRVRPGRTMIFEDTELRAQMARRGESWYSDMAVADSPAAMKYALALVAGVTDETFLQALDESASAFQGQLPAEPFSAPALIIAGRQDSVVGYEEAWQLAKTYSRATFVVLDRAGHLAFGEQPGLYSVLTNEWVDRVEEWIQTKSPKDGDDEAIE